MKKLLFVFSTLIVLMASNFALAQETKFYLKNGSVVQGECIYINDTSFIALHEVKQEKGNSFFSRSKYDTLIVKKTELEKIIFKDSLSDLSAEIQIVYKDNISNKYIIRGIDLNKNLIFAGSWVNDYYKTDTINLDNPNIEKIIVLGESRSWNIVKGFVFGGIAGLLAIELIDKIANFNNRYPNSDNIIPLVGILIGAVPMAIIEGYYSRVNIVVLQNPGMKYELLENIYYPKIISEKSKDKQ